MERQEEIKLKMEELYNFWFSNREIWFNGERSDEMIYKKYYSYYTNYDYMIEDKSEINIENRKFGISLILLCDQIIRHIVRYDMSKIIFEIEREKVLDEYNKLGMKISKIIYDKYNEEITDEEYCFIMLPYRHNGSYQNYKYVLEETWKRINYNEIIRKFMTATYNRYLKNNDDIENIIKIEDKIVEFNKRRFDSVLDRRCIKNVINREYKIEIDIKDNLIYDRKNKIILSISGGVDSMVCSYLLKKYGIDYVCVHINYMNREESIKEEEFVVEWCKYMDIPIYIRRITEINRIKCMKNNFRNLYEDYTRDIRYNTYKQVSKMIKNKECNVILGHNKDDCFENIMTNITNKNKYENLFGMEIKSRIDDINFIRPMLNIDKTKIYEIADNIDISYLWDSTPEWSQRGKIRDKVRPVLEEWNNKSIEGFFELKRVMEDSNKLIDELIETISDNIEIKDRNIKIEFKKEKVIKNKIFWKKILNKYRIDFSIKSLDNFIERIEKLINIFDNLHINHINSYQMNKNYIVNIIKRKNNIIEILFNFI
jgi:tRNA(Ile)-lysidine synthetase-like protein